MEEGGVDDDEKDYVSLQDQLTFALLPHCMTPAHSCCCLPCCSSGRIAAEPAELRARAAREGGHAVEREGRAARHLRPLLLNGEQQQPGSAWWRITDETHIRVTHQLKRWT